MGATVATINLLLLYRVLVSSEGSFQGELGSLIAKMVIHCSRLMNVFSIQGIDFYNFARYADNGDSLFETHERIRYTRDRLLQLREHKCYIVATCDRDLKRRIRKIPGVPIMYITRYSYSIEQLPEATIGGAPRV